MLSKGYDVQKGQAWLCDRSFLDLFNQMLCFKPEHRISPAELLEHEFMSGFVPHYLLKKSYA